ncbi:MAG: 30S ribosomal protein S4 [Elusimicrobia bacterium]|nr:30S ribosomal protein S4 [Elusimicrobiota bacterium]
MARHIGPVCRLCRREQVKLFLKGDKCYTKCVLDKRPTPPGVAKPQRGKPSEYAIRLREKQKLRRLVLMTERPFERLYQRATKATGRTGEALLRYLECRLDNVCRRLGYSTSIKGSRQLVAHGHVKVNGRYVNIPAYEVAPGDLIQLDPKVKENVNVKLSLDTAARKSTRPSFFEFDEATLTAKMVREPSREECTFPVTEQLIVEYYSK